MEKIMSTMVKNINPLIIYCILLLSYTLGFFYLRTLFHANEQYTLLRVSAFLYGFAIFVTVLICMYYGRVFKGDRYYGLIYHLVSYLIVNLIWFIWIEAGLSTPHDSIWNVLSVMIAWGLGLLGHSIYYLVSRKNMIKGIPKDEVFE